MVCETHLGYVHGLGGREKRFLLKLLPLVIVSRLTKSQFSLPRRELFVIHVHQSFARAQSCTLERVWRISDMMTT